MNKNILLICPGRNDATSFYRGFGPFGALRKTININIIPGDQVEITWATLALVDAVFLQRPFTKSHLTICEMTTDRGIPLIIDFDDDLFSVPKENPTFDMYSRKDLQENIRNILKMATVVTVTNNYLKNKLMRESAQDSSKFIVIPNAHNDFHFKKQHKKQEEKTNVIFWRGSKTHDKDLMDYAVEMIQVSRDYPKMVFAFLGCNPWFIENGIASNQYVYYKSLDIYDYFRTVKNLSPIGFQVPLTINEFNRSKSSIAAMEAAYFGSTSLVPEWEDWKMPGTLVYRNRDQYQDGLRAIIENRDNCQANADLTWQYIQDNLLLSNVNNKRIEILKNL